jgi:hypothetical protein
MQSTSCISRPSICADHRIDIPTTSLDPFARNYVLALLPRARYMLISLIVQARVVHPLPSFLGFLRISLSPLMHH